MNEGGAEYAWVLTKHSFASLFVGHYVYKGCRSNDSHNVVFVVPWRRSIKLTRLRLEFQQRTRLQLP